MRLLLKAERKGHHRQLQGGIDAIKSILGQGAWDKARMGFFMWQSYVQRAKVANKLAHDTRLLMRTVHENNLTGALRLLDSMLHVHAFSACFSIV